MLLLIVGLILFFGLHSIAIVAPHWRERMLLMMKEVEGFSVEELAAKTGLNENTIKVKLFRARQKLVKAAQRLDRAPGLVAG